MARHVIVTGAAGLLGSHVAAAFRQAQWQVTALDVAADKSRNIGQADLRDLKTAHALVRDADCVAHIASIPRPVGYAAHEVFDTNMSLMFNVQSAMEEAGIGKLLFASSFSVLGLPFAERPVKLHYFPVDESHPVAPQDVYAVTKWLGEEMVDAWARRTGGTAVSLRMPWIQTAQSFLRDVVPRRARKESGLDLWAYIDARDAARAFVLAAEAPLEGHSRMFISASDTYHEYPTPLLLSRSYPDVEVREELPGHAAVISSTRARELIGFVPEHSWRQYGGS
ncbi:NAD(P)-dependent oxidoreductase [Chelativorans sp.]|uniref:NAD-dependent epimerase/dehydratase family protein n=1 Tax=Chelativorans sp. TaxID=2203393 RepID=UPI0028126B20|nr:NAD(P)-dependent oxidoreductase [Chelativorans sp.]